MRTSSEVNNAPQTAVNDEITLHDQLLRDQCTPLKWPEFIYSMAICMFSPKIPRYVRWLSNSTAATLNR